MARTAQEWRLAEVFANVLNLESVGLNDNFFDLGGDSQAAFRCLTAIRSEFGLTSLPPSLFLYAPTVAQMVHKLFEPPRSDGRACVFPIQPKGEGAPLFVVSPGIEYRGLARHLGRARRIIGIAVPNLERFPPPHTIEWMAAECVASLRRFQPEGPYALAGWCHAGVIALEMAQQLEAAGAQVSLLTLIDAPDIFLPPMNPFRRSFVQTWRY
jgi:acyl carrier protein